VKKAGQTYLVVEGWRHGNIFCLGTTPLPDRPELRPPFNIAAREATGFPAAFYQPISKPDELFAPPADTR